MIETTPADSAASNAETDVSGVWVPPIVTTDARLRVVGTPENPTPLTVSDVHELLPEL